MAGLLELESIEVRVTVGIGPCGSWIKPAPVSKSPNPPSVDPLKVVVLQHECIISALFPQQNFCVRVPSVAGQG